jgi:uncharacterized membrane protein
MSDEPATALIAVYPNRAYADAAVAHLLDVERSGHFGVDGIGMVTKDVDGRVRSEEVGKSPGKHGVKRGAVLGAVVGIILTPGVVAATAIGAGIGGVSDHLRGHSRSPKQLQMIAEQIDPGHVGVIVIVNGAESDQVADAFVGYTKFYRVPLDFDTPISSESQLSNKGPG